MGVPSRMNMIMTTQYMHDSASLLVIDICFKHASNVSLLMRFSVYGVQLLTLSHITMRLSRGNGLQATCEI
jgi:hypothetical protein